MWDYVTAEEFLYPEKDKRFWLKSSNLQKTTELYCHALCSFVQSFHFLDFMQKSYIIYYII